MKAFVSRFPVLTMVAITLGYQFLVVAIVAHLLPEGAKIHDNEAAHMVFRFRVFGPIVFAVLLTAYIEGKDGLRNLFGAYFHWKVPAKWYALAFSWKFIFTYVGITFVFLLGLKEWPGAVVPNFFGGDWSTFHDWLANVPFIIGIAIVEETAWMKFCVTRLQERYSALASCLLVGLAWGFWYLPMLLLGDGVPDGYPWPMFMLSMLALTILLGWTYNMTRSGLILLIMQMVSNCAFFIVPVLPGLRGDLDPTYINSFVIVNASTAILLVAIYGWRELGVRRRARWSEGMPTGADRPGPSPALAYSAPS